MDGWMVVGHEGELQQAGIARYMSGWGTQLPDNVVRELTRGTAPTEWIEDGFVIEFTQGDVDRVAELVRQVQAAREAKRAAQRMVKCSCGHTVPAHEVMAASRGRSCADCYDRMSD